MGIGASMTSGKARLLEVIGAFVGGGTVTPDELERRLKPCGFLLNRYGDDAILHGPLGHVKIESLSEWGGLLVFRELDVLCALAHCLHVGPPVWERSIFAQANWWRAQIDQCEDFQVPVDQPLESRQDMEEHLDACDLCRPASQALSEAISLGSANYSDKHIAQLINRCHADPDEALRFYVALRDSFSMNLKLRKKSSVGVSA
jgi:hypothetical protein